MIIACVDENETRSGGGGSGPRRVGDARREQEADRNRRESELGTSWTSVIFGWLAALGAGFILTGIIAATQFRSTRALEDVH